MFLSIGPKALPVPPRWGDAEVSTPQAYHVSGRVRDYPAVAVFAAGSGFDSHGKLEIQVVRIAEGQQTAAGSERMFVMRYAVSRENTCESGCFRPYITLKGLKIPRERKLRTPARDGKGSPQCCLLPSPDHNSGGGRGRADQVKTIQKLIEFIHAHRSDGLHRRYVERIAERRAHVDRAVPPPISIEGKIIPARCSVAPECVGYL